MTAKRRKIFYLVGDPLLGDWVEKLDDKQVELEELLLLIEEEYSSENGNTKLNIEGQKD